MSNKLRNKLLLAILVIAAFMRLYGLDSLPPGLYSDEAVNGVNTLGALHLGNFKIFYPENFGREGLFINIQAFSVALFGPEAWALRLVSSLFGIFTVLGIYFLGRELILLKETISGNIMDESKKWFAEKIGLLSAFLLATSFWHINFSRIGFRAIMAPFFGVWAFYFLFLAYRKSNDESASLSYLYLGGLAGLFLGLGLHSYIAFRALPILAVLIFVILAKQTGWKKTLRISAVFIVFSLLVFAPLGIYFAQNPADFFGRTSAISIFNSPSLLTDLAGNILKTIGMFNIAGDFNPRHNLAGTPELFVPVGVLFLVGFYLAARNLFRKSERIVPIFLLGWIFIAALPVVVSNESLPHSLRAILMIPPVFILAGMGGLKLYASGVEKFTASSQISTERSLKILKGFAIFLALMLIAEAYTKYFITWANDPKTAGAFNKEATETAYELRKLPNELKKYVIAPRGNMRVNIVQFLTDTATLEEQKKKNIYYFTPGEIDENQAKNGIYVIYLE